MQDRAALGVVLMLEGVGRAAPEERGDDHQVTPVRFRRTTRSAARHVAIPATGSPRWLVPREAGLRRVSAQLYEPQKVLGRLRKRLMAWGVHPSTPVEIDEVDALAAIVAEVAGVREVELAFSLGTPGAYRKATALALTPNGRRLAVVKIARHELAQAALRSESETIARLNEVPSLRSSVPTLLQRGRWGDAAVMVTSVGPEQAGPTTLSDAHRTFLARVRAQFGRQAAFSDSSLWKSDVRWFHGRADWLGDALASILSRAFQVLEEGLGGERVPLSLGHRDFVPWNTRLGADGSLFVFDWETARPDAPAFLDAFHFVAMQACKRGTVPLSSDPIVHAVADFLGYRDRRSRRLLYLAYLVDAAAYYIEARFASPSTKGDDVEAWLLRQVEVVLDEVSHAVA